MAVEIFRHNQGILRASQAEKLGINRPTLARLVTAGVLIKEGRGLYRLNTIELNYPDLVLVSRRIPRAVIGLLSALSFHNLTDHIPHKVYIVLPRDNKRPSIEYPPIDVTRVNDKVYSTGIEKHEIDDVVISIYSKPKTIADCFKFHNKVGDDIALEALRNYLRGPDAEIEALLSCARVNRVEKIMLPYIRASL